MKVLTVPEAAEYLKISKWTMHRLLKSKQVKGVQFCKRGQWRVSQEALDSYMGGGLVRLEDSK